MTTTHDPSFLTRDLEDLPPLMDPVTPTPVFDRLRKAYEEHYSKQLTELFGTSRPKWSYKAALHRVQLENNGISDDMLDARIRSALANHTVPNATQMHKTLRAEGRSVSANRVKRHWKAMQDERTRGGKS